MSLTLSILSFPFVFFFFLPLSGCVTNYLHQLHRNNGDMSSINNNKGFATINIFSPPTETLLLPLSSLSMVLCWELYLSRHLNYFFNENPYWEIFSQHLPCPTLSTRKRVIFPRNIFTPLLALIYRSDFRTLLLCVCVMLGPLLFFLFPDSHTFLPTKRNRRRPDSIQLISFQRTSRNYCATASPFFLPDCGHHSSSSRSSPLLRACPRLLMLLLLLISRSSS